MPKKGIVSLQDYSKIASTHMVKEVFKFLDFYEKNLGKNTSPQLFKDFLKTLTEQYVLQALNVLPKDKRSGKDALDTTRKSFGRTKVTFQDAIADGYANAAFKFSGMDVDYHVTIATVPEPENTTNN